MSFHQPDPSNAPAPSALQQFEIFKGKGGKVGEFALQTARTSNKIFALEAHPIEGGSIHPIKGQPVAFLGGMFRLDGDLQTIQAAWVIMGKIRRTAQILAGNQEVASIPEFDENLGINYIGNH